MSEIDPECHLWGPTFSPSRLQKMIPNIEITFVTEPGEIKTIGRNKGKPAEYGACCITTPKEIELPKRIEYMADFMKQNMWKFKKSGAVKIIYWLYWTGKQGNMEFKPRELKKIASLGVPFCIDYIQEEENSEENEEN